MGQPLRNTIVSLFLLVAPPAPPAPPALPGPPALRQASFEQTIQELRSADARVRYRAVRLLNDAAYPEAAVPLAAVVADPEDAIQLEAIAAELNTFITDKIVSKKKVGLVVEVRNRVDALRLFSAGLFTLGPDAVPIEVLAALRSASHDRNPKVALEAMYAFGVLSSDPVGLVRREMLRTAGPDLAAMTGVSNPTLRLAAVRVIGRAFATRPRDAAVSDLVGDAVVAAINDTDANVRGAAVEAIGAMRYARGVQALSDLVAHYGRGPWAEASCDALARIAHESSAAFFTAQLAGRDAAMKRCAIEGIARLAVQGRAADIQAALAGERNETLLLAGHFAFAMFSAPSPDRIAPIAEALARSKLRNQAFGYLLELAPARAAAFAPIAKHPGAGIRTDVANVLGWSAAAEALPIVEPLTRDADARVAGAAARAVAHLRAATRPEP